MPTICITNVDHQSQFMGGIKRVSITLAHAWVAKGYNVFFLCACAGEHFADLEGIEQVFLPNPLVGICEENITFCQRLFAQRGVTTLYHPHVQEREMTALCIRLRQEMTIRLISHCHFAPTHDVVLGDANFFLPYRKQILKDCLLWLRWKLYKRKQVMQQVGAYFQQVYNKSDILVLLSEKFIPAFQQLTKTTGEKLCAMPNPLWIQPAHNIPPKDKMVVWCGRIGYGMKRTDRMLQIWKQVAARYPDWHCYVLGSGNIELWQGLAAQANIPHIHFTGSVNPLPYYEKASILCCTSTTEGFGMMLLEAQAHGCVPMAFASYASVTDIIDNGRNGILIPPFHIDAYSQKLMELMHNEQAREQMAKQGLQTIQRFDIQTITEQWDKLLCD